MSKRLFALAVKDLLAEIAVNTAEFKRLSEQHDELVLKAIAKNIDLSSHGIQIKDNFVKDGKTVNSVFRQKNFKRFEFALIATKSDKPKGIKKKGQFFKVRSEK